MSDMTYRVAIIGCGLIGKKRGHVVSLSSQAKPEAMCNVAGVCDIVEERVRGAAATFNCEAETDWERIVSRPDIDIVINSAINAYLEPITVRALQTGKHVLCEKPLGRNSAEALRMVRAANEHQLLLKTGFNHRFHPALWKAKQVLDAGEIGKCLNIRARYGHGGRPGMEKEWRASKELCGGGELLDQGVHVIDLIRWFGGEITEVYGRVETKFWPMEVEDNAFAILKTGSDATASFHVSWTNWKNIFSFEVFGADGYLRIEGLGGSYGPETLEFGRRRKEGGAPDIERYEFPSEDVSWRLEWEDFLSAIRDKRPCIGDAIDGLRANQVIEAIYQSSSEGRVVKLMENVE
ncbi:MAG: Gfo/Idh/MocA family oxidoreductase [Deltaproteobacteria bacterium]